VPLFDHCHLILFAADIDARLETEEATCIIQVASSEMVEVAGQ
jgi:hypothetical protein